MQAMASAIKFCAVVFGGVAVIAIMTLAPILKEWVTAKGRGSCGG